MAAAVSRSIRRASAEGVVVLLPQTPNPLTDNQFIFSVNFEEAPALTGAYQVEGCEGTSPVLE